MAFWDDGDEIERPSHFQDKTMIAVFVNGTGDSQIVSRSKEQKTNSTFVIECVLGPLTECCYPQGKKSHDRRVRVHFNNARTRNTEAVQDYLENVRFTRMKHPPSGRDKQQDAKREDSYHEATQRISVSQNTHQTEYDELPETNIDPTSCVRTSQTTMDIRQNRKNIDVKL
jgi:hypothetical protein